MKITELDGKCKIEKYDGYDTCVTLPDKVEEKPLAVIGAKAFLSCRTVERLELSGTVECIGDWAFAHMKNLQEIIIPAKKINFGKKVFLGCNNLKRVSLSQTEGIYEGIPYLFASMVIYMEEHPIEPEIAGDSKRQWEWLRDYDKSLMKFLEREDTYGFEPAFIGWFNVEDVDDQKDAYMTERKKCKIHLCLQRLLYNEKLGQEAERMLANYLINANSLLAELFTEPESVYGKDVRHYKLWQRIGGFEVISPKEWLIRLQDADPEVRAYLMECQLSEKSGEDFFGELEL